MITVAILEDTDRIQPDDWCRPLSLCTMSGGMSDSMSFRGMGGTPENNVKWVRARHQFGAGWMGSTVGEFNKEMREFGDCYEFVRGQVPRQHQLDMRGYLRADRT